jgi:hypothetical protein
MKAKFHTRIWIFLENKTIGFVKGAAPEWEAQMLLISLPADFTTISLCKYRQGD